jgi:hypothetical protein
MRHHGMSGSASSRSSGSGAPLLALRCARAARAASKSDIGQKRQQDQTVPPCERSEEGQRDEQERAEDHHDVGPARIAGGVQARDDRGNTENQQDIRRVRPHDIAQRQPRHTVEDRLDGDEKLGRGGAEGDDGQRHDQRRNAEAKAEVHRALHQDIAGQEEDDEAEPRQSELCRHASALPFGAMRARPAAQVVAAAGLAKARFGKPPCRRVILGRRRRPNMASTAMKIRNSETILSITTGRTARRPRAPPARGDLGGQRQAEASEEAALLAIDGEPGLVAVKLLHLGNQMADAVGKAQLDRLVPVQNAPVKSSGWSCRRSPRLDFT